jgi:hypothetical protein
MLVQLRVQVSQEDASLHSHLLLFLVHLQEPAQAGRSQAITCLPPQPGSLGIGVYLSQPVVSENHLCCGWPKGY